jgi:hypothetical protein
VNLLRRRDGGPYARTSGLVLPLASRRFPESGRLLGATLDRCADVHYTPGLRERCLADTLPLVTKWRGRSRELGAADFGTAI